MLPAPPVVKISAKGPDMAGTASAGRDQTPSDGASRPAHRPTSGGGAERHRPARERAAAKRSAGAATKAAAGAGSRAKRTASAGESAQGVTTLPVREGEEGWTPAELTEIRQQLEAERGELREEIARAESDIATRMGDVSEGAGDDQADAGAKTYAREHEMALTYNARDLLAQNERALQRIDGGTYGVCESCGQPIGKARLQAFPRATLCVRCKQREERR